MRNVAFQIVDTTLREGEQSALADFTPEQRVAIAQGLDEFGVEYIEVLNPVSSEENFRSVRQICGLGLRSRVVSHVRCVERDIERAVEAGVDGVNVLLFGTSSQLQASSHGRNVASIIEESIRVLQLVRNKYPELEIRVSAEDAFRSRLTDILSVYHAVTQCVPVQRLGMADTTGIATPDQVKEMTTVLKREFGLPLEFHGHNDCGCAIANAFAFIDAGGDFVDTTILGIGERNGIVPLAGLIARMYPFDGDIAERYVLSGLTALDGMVAGFLNIDIPFNQCLTSPYAFSHKAGLHTKAVLNNPNAYEIFNPLEFGQSRVVNYWSGVSGRHSIANRAKEMGFELKDQQLQVVASIIKEAASTRKLTSAEADGMIRGFLNSAAHPSVSKELELTGFLPSLAGRMTSVFPG